jgi:hypothetical protein
VFSQAFEAPTDDERPKETGSAYQEDNNKIAQNTHTNGKKITGKQQRSHHHHQQLRKAKTNSPQKKKTVILCLTSVGSRGSKFSHKQTSQMFFFLNERKKKRRGAGEGGEERDEKEENEKAYTIQRRIAMMRRRSQRLWNTDDCNSNRFRTDLYAIDKAQTCERGFGEEAAAAAAEATERSLRGENAWGPPAALPSNPMHSLQRGDNHKAPTGCNPSPPSQVPPV